MTQTEQILEYIDGMLDPHAEQTLFDAMARQPELRSALRQFIAIGDAVRADREAYTPPAHVERSLMSGLGMEPGLAAPVAGAVAGTGLFARLTSLGGRLLGMVVAFLLGALLAGGTVYLMMQPSPTADVMAGNRAAVQRNTDAGGPAGSDKGSSGGAVPQAGGGTGGNDADAGHGTNTVGTETFSGREDVAEAAGSRLNDHIMNGRARSRESATALHSGDDGVRDRSGAGGRGSLPDGNLPRSEDRRMVEDGGEISDGMAVREIEPAMLRPVPVLREELQAAPAELVPQSAPENLQEPVPFGGEDAAANDGVLAVELRRNFGGTFNPNQARRSTPAFDNWMFGMMVRPSELFSFGIEAGHESFDQTLYYSDDDTLQVEQRPSFVWVGVAGRLRVAELPLADADAFLQGTVAYSTGGPVVRMRLAGQMPLAGGLDAIAGLETSALVYTFRNQYALSGRWGFTTGVMWTF